VGAGCVKLRTAAQGRIGNNLSAVLATPRLDRVARKAEAREKVFHFKRSKFAFSACLADRAPWRHLPNILRIQPFSFTLDH
jgi:hypothetical protein